MPKWDKELTHDFDDRHSQLDEADHKVVYDTTAWWNIYIYI